MNIKTKQNGLPIDADACNRCDEKMSGETREMGEKEEIGSVAFGPNTFVLRGEFLKERGRIEAVLDGADTFQSDNVIPPQSYCSSHL